MTHCALCREIIVPDMPGLNPCIIEVYEGEQFLVHEKCGNWIQGEHAKQKTQLAKARFTFKILSMMSDGSGGFTKEEK